MKANGWHRSTLGEACRFIDYRGKTPTKTQSGLRLITAKNVKMGFLQMEPLEFVAPNSYASWMTRGIPLVGDVLFTTEAPLANVAQLDTDEKVVFAQRIIILQPFKTDLDRTFLKYLLLSDVAQERIRAKGTGATVQGIKASLLKGIPIEFPPLPEQQRIVGILDEAFAGIATAKANAEKNLRNVRDLFSSHLEAEFSDPPESWRDKPIGEICELLGGFAFKSGDAVATSQTQLVRMGNLYGNKMNLARSPVFYPDGFAKEYRRYLLGDGDLIMSLTGTTGKEDYGYAVRVPSCEHSLLMNQRLVKFDRVKPEVDGNYLFYFLRSRKFLDQLYATAHGTRQANVSSVSIRQIGIPLGPVAEQKKVASAIDDLTEETQRLASLYQQKVAALDALKKSLLHQAFSGQL